METVAAVGIFLAVLLLIEGVFYLVKDSRRPEEHKIKRRFRTFSAAGYKKEDINILRTTRLSEIPWFNQLLFSVPNALRMSRFLEQANARYPLGFYLLLSALLIPVGYTAGVLLNLAFPLRLAFALFGAALPFLFLYVKKRQRMLKFERQLPDALDMIARALKAGHAFPGGVKMAADEFDDPIGTELEKTLDEINFGVGVPEALKALAMRVDCPDLKFFVISVIIQRETGGNLAELMESLSYLIRERFKLQGRVRVLSSEGKFSAIILMALPIFLALYLFVTTRSYITTLFVDPIGKVMVIGAIVMMLLGAFVMSRMVKIRV